VIAIDCNGVIALEFTSEGMFRAALATQWAGARLRSTDSGPTAALLTRVPQGNPEF